MYFINKLLFGLLYLLGADVINNPHKYKKLKPTSSAKEFLLKVLFVAMILIGLSFFFWFFLLALLLVTIASIFVYFQRSKKAKDSDHDNGSPPV